MMDDFELEEQQGLEPILEPNEEVQEDQELAVSQEMVDHTFSNKEKEVELVKESRSELKVEDIIEQGRYGVSNSQMIPEGHCGRINREVDSIEENVLLYL
ncbi:hypothetical protein [Anaerospora sp.]|uniref:hypothetical protein n=1 Tax=Anaerospora sp. TaxID=1960278 RepID=UPI00289B75EF|nr:hypothetical protein [Anaerospora sp.]